MPPKPPKPPPPRPPPPPPAARRIGGTPTHGYGPSREVAMAAFRQEAGGGSSAVEADDRGGSNQHPASLNVKTARSWRDIVTFTHPRTGGAHDGYHQTAG